MPRPFFDWPPFKLVALDADTGKPLDPNVGMRVCRDFYNVRKAKDGKKVMTRKRVDFKDQKGNVMTEDVKKDGKGGGDAGKKGSEEKKESSGDAQQASPTILFTFQSKKLTRLKKPSDADFTAKDDKRLMEMKAVNKSWKEITAELDRPKNVLKDRYNHLNALQGGGGEVDKNKSGDKKQDGGNGKDDKQNEKSGHDKGDKKGGKENKQAKGDKNSNEKPSAKAPSKAPSRTSSRDVRFTGDEWKNLQEDDLFSFGELQCLTELIMREDRQRWLRIASAFADRTGRRVHPEDIREKFEEIGRMG